MSTNKNQQQRHTKKEAIQLRGTLQKHIHANNNDFQRASAIMTIIHRFKRAYPVDQQLWNSSGFMPFDPLNVNLTSTDPKDVVCYLTYGVDQEDSYDHQGARISAVFVILLLATVATMFPVLAAKSESLRIPLYAYLMARYFGSGVIIATSFIHLLDPAYSEIGPQTCVGMTGAWSNYSWPPAIAMTSAMCVFLLDFTVECHVQAKYGLENINVHGDIEGTVTRTHATTDGHHHQHQHHRPSAVADEAHYSKSSSTKQEEKHEEPADLQLPQQYQGTQPDIESPPTPPSLALVAVVNTPCPLENKQLEVGSLVESQKQQLELVCVENNKQQLEAKQQQQQLETDKANERDFQKQIAAFLVLEFGVIFHSVIIGLNLGVAGSEFRTLYPVLTLHQAFEGLGIGARLSTIPFPHRLRHAPWLLCLLFGMTTPIAMAIGLSLRSSYAAGSFTADVVSGILDSTSAGILLYTGFVEFLARDFLFHPERTSDKTRVTFMICCLYLGITVMALLGKWA